MYSWFIHECNYFLLNLATHQLEEDGFDMASKATKNVFCQFYLVVKLNLKAKNPMRVKLVSGGSVINGAYLV